jgi:hypothetical protein
MNLFRHKLVALSLLAGGSMLFGCVSPRPLALDLYGTPLNPLTGTNTIATVLVFVSNDCPLANRYVPEIQRLRDTFAPRGVNFWLVHADPSETPAEIREHARQFGLSLPVLRDPDRRLVKLARIQVTPSAALFTRGKSLVYHGRIDDRAADLGKERAEPSHRDLAEAIEAVLAGRPVRVAATEAVGCSIPGRE